MADLTPKDISERLASADKLQAAADTAAGHVRNLYIAFLSFGLYLAIAVGATTDEQLLRGSPVRLPIVDVGLPLVAFYWIAPLLFVLFHFNLLLQLYLLSVTLRRLDAGLRGVPDEAERRATLSQFVFTQMLIGDHRADNGRPVIQWLLNLIAWTTFVILPIAVLLLTQIQFLPYHDPYTTWWQRFLIAADLLLLWLLWLRAIDPGGFYRQASLVMRRRARHVQRWLAEPLDWPAWPIIGLLALIHAVPTLPARIRRRLEGDAKRDWRLLRLQEISAISLLVALLVATIPGEFLAGPIDGVISQHGNIGPLNRNLSLVEAKLVLQVPEPSLIENIGEQKALEKYTSGLELRGRNFRYADLSLADLRKADLRRAGLQGADLGAANLWRATIGDEPNRDELWRLADLRGADLEPADVDRLIAELQDQLEDEQTRSRVLARLEYALRDDERPEAPSWQGEPEVMFSSDDPIAVALDWGTPAMSDEEYDKNLAGFLGDLACGEDGSPAVAEDLARRATRPGVFGGEPDRLLTQLLARRLTIPRTARLPPSCRRTCALSLISSPRASMSHRPMRPPGRIRRPPHCARRSPERHGIPAPEP